jgi:MYXO-CTERM domain-containing protein
MRHLWFILTAFLGLALQAVPASAALTYTLNCSTKMCTGSGGNNNFGTVGLTQGASGDVVVTVTLAANETFANLSSGYAILWNITGNPGLTITPQGSNAGDFAVQNNGNPNLYLASPFGHNNNNCSGANATSCFDYAVARNNISGSDTQLVFDVTSSAGLVLSNFDGTSEGFAFAAMIYQSGNNTPFYVASNGTPVPEPQTWTMSIAGLAGLAGLLMLQRRRRRLARAQ